MFMQDFTAHTWEIRDVAKSHQGGPPAVGSFNLPVDEKASALVVFLRRKVVENCSGLMNPDTDLGENARHGEVSDAEATSFVFPEFKQQAASLVLDQGYNFSEASRSVGIGESVLRRWVLQLQMERQASRRRARQSRRISNVFRNSRRASNASSVRRPF